MPTVMPTNKTTPKGPISNSAPMPFRKRKFFGEKDPTAQNAGGMTGPPMQEGAGKNSMFADGRKGQPQGNVPMTPNRPLNGPGPSRVSGQPQYMAPATPNYPMMGPGRDSVSGQPQGGMPMTPNYPQAHMANGRKPMMPGQKMQMALGRKQQMPPAPMMADGWKQPMVARPMGGRPMPMHHQQMPPAPMMADGGIGAPSMMGGDEPDADDMPQGGPMDQAPPDAGDGSAAAGPLPVIDPAAVNYHDDPRSCAPGGVDGSPGCQYFENGNCSVLQMQVAGTGGCSAFSGMQGGGDQDMPPANGGAPQSAIGTSDGGV